MAKTIVGLYDDLDDARDAVQELVDEGFDREDISLVARDRVEEYEPYVGRYEEGEEGYEYTEPEENVADGAAWGAVVGALVGLGALFIPGIGLALVGGPIVTALVAAGIGAATGGLIGALVDAGIPDEEAEVYAEGVRRGGTLVMVYTTDAMADEATDILNDFDPVDVNERAEQWRANEEWEGFDYEAEPYVTEDIDREREMYRRDYDEDLEEEDTLPVAEEELRVGKREVPAGGVRVHTRVVEEPVEEEVTLRREEVDVERRDVDRPISEAEADEVFEEGTIEVTGEAEEVVTDKQARVTGEVSVDKDVEVRTEVIRDTLRHTEVDIEEIDPEAEAGYERHYGTEYQATGREYDYYQPAYRYGYAVGTNETFADRDWAEVEPEMRRDWERRHPDTAWEDVKEAVREGWESVT